MGLRRLFVVAPTTSKPTALRLAAWALAAYPLGLSLSPHKEFRFLLPVLPLACLLGAFGLAPLLSSSPATTTSSSSNTSGPLTPRGAQRHDATARQEPTRSRRRASCVLVSLLLAVQAPMAWYFSRVHQRGPLDVVAYLSRQLQPASAPSAVRIDFLLPCHATPWASHLHVPSVYPRLILRHLDCGPEARARGDAETDVFLADPLRFAQALYDEQRAPVPHYVVAFASAAAALDGYLARKGLGREAAFFYSAFKGDVDSAQLEDSLVVFGRRRVGVDDGQGPNEPTM